MPLLFYWYDSILESIESLRSMCSKSIFLQTNFVTCLELLPLKRCLDTRFDNSPKYKFEMFVIRNS